MTLPYEKLSWCPYYKIGTTEECHYSTVKEGSVPAVFRDNNENVKIPPSLPNGGLYGSPQSKNPWANIPVTPSMTNLIHHNLRSANPPPGATEQYVGTNRLGNNYSAMPGTYWYNPSNKKGLYNIIGTK
tara:strand:+ start:321 stop:707 length:387 start_codon:yes stop_codon:yes gene_type:complete